MKTKKWMIAIGVLVVAVVGLTLYSKKRNVQYLQAKKGDVLEAIYGLGKVETDEVYELKIGVMANVDHRFVHEGDSVKKGDSLISFDSIGVFRAPFAGTVTFAEYNDGEVVSPQAPVLRLENLDKKFIEVSLEQDAALKVRSGQKAKLVFQNISDGTLQGQVDKIYPKGGEFIARIEATDINPHVLPGMTVDVVIEVGSKKDVTLIPLKAITEGKVIRVRDGKRKKIPVITGHSDGLWAQLIEGDVLITDQLLVKGK